MTCKLDGLAAKFNSFGVGTLDQSVQIIDFDTITYPLYPNGNGTNVHLSYMMTTIEGSLVKMSLFHSNKTKDFGIRVSEANCFQKLVQLFKTLTNVILSNPDDPSSISTISVFGFIMLV